MDTLALSELCAAYLVLHIELATIPHDMLNTSPRAVQIGLQMRGLLEAMRKIVAGQDE